MMLVGGDKSIPSSSWVMVPSGMAWGEQGGKIYPLKQPQTGNNRPCESILICSLLLDLEKDMAIHSSILAWEIPWTEETCRLPAMGSQRAGHDWATKQLLLESRPVSHFFRSEDGLQNFTPVPFGELSGAHRSSPVPFEMVHSHQVIWDWPGERITILYLIESSASERTLLGASDRKD